MVALNTCQRSNCRNESYGVCPNNSNNNNDDDNNNIRNNSRLKKCLVAFFSFCLSKKFSVGGGDMATWIPKIIGYVKMETAKNAGIWRRWFWGKKVKLTKQHSNKAHIAWKVWWNFKGVQYPIVIVASKLKNKLQYHYNVSFVFALDFAQF